MITKHLEFDCGCADDVVVRAKESRTLLKVGRKTVCRQHGTVTIVTAEEIASDGEPLIREILGRG